MANGVSAAGDSRVWFITGCSTGFGRELARHLLASGYRVVVTARKPEALKEFDDSAQALVLKLDVTDNAQVDAAVKAAQERFGRIVASPAYRTPAVGFDGPDFLNNAVMLETDLPLAELDDWLHAVEDAHGRDRSGPRFSDRTLDIDVVYYGDLVVEAPADGPHACFDVTSWFSEDGRDALIAWDRDTLAVYLPDDGPFFGDKKKNIYKPVRPSASNKSNYQAYVSLPPGW